MTLLYPSKCMLCGQRIAEKQRGLCESCRVEMEQRMRELYLPAPHHTDGLVCAGMYEGRLRRAVLHYKFYGQRAYGRPLAELAAQAWELHQMPKPDLLTCVPISPVHAHGRGFNQSEQLAKYIAARWNIPFEHTLRRRVLARRQRELNAQDRWLNARRTYYPRYTANVDGKNILLVDDIVTTGATVSTCAGLLREMGAVCVWALGVTKTR